MKKKHVVIVGPGAVGSKFAAQIAAAGECDVSIVGRRGDKSRKLQGIRDHGVGLVLHAQDKKVLPQGSKAQEISLDDGSERRKWVVAVGDLGGKVVEGVKSQVATLDEADVIYITVKSYDLNKDFYQHVIQPLHAKNPNAVFCFAQNGVPFWIPSLLSSDRTQGRALPHVDPNGEFFRLIQQNRVPVVGVVLQRITNTMLDVPGMTVTEDKLPPCSDEHVKMGSVTAPADAVELASIVLARANIRSAVATDFTYDLFSKLLLNVGGALTILSNRPLGKTYDDSSSEEAAGLSRQACLVAEALLKEVLVVADLLGVTISDVGPYVNSMRAKTLYKPSMLVDAERGRRFEDIVGGVCDLANILGCQVPGLLTLNDILSDIQSRKTPFSDDLFAKHLERIKSLLEVADVGLLSRGGDAGFVERLEGEGDSSGLSSVPSRMSSHYLRNLFIQFALRQSKDGVPLDSAVQRTFLSMVAEQHLEAIARGGRGSVVSHSTVRASSVSGGSLTPDSGPSSGDDSDGDGSPPRGASPILGPRLLVGNSTSVSESLFGYKKPELWDELGFVAVVSSDKRKVRFLVKPPIEGLDRLKASISEAHGGQELGAYMYDASGSMVQAMGLGSYIASRHAHQLYVSFTKGRKITADVIGAVERMGGKVYQEDDLRAEYGHGYKFPWELERANGQVV